MSIISASGQHNSLRDLMQSNELQVGDLASYQICKTIFAYHPIGSKFATLPVDMAFSKPRGITLSDHPKIVKERFETTYEKLGVWSKIKQALILSRVYGMSSVMIGQYGKGLDEALDVTTIKTNPLFFNVLDPLNTAGSLINNQDPLSGRFLSVSGVQVMGKPVHASRCFIKNNGEEQPLYLQWSQSAFCYGGRSVYQRALPLLKQYLKSIQVDEYLLDKVGALVVKSGEPQGVYDSFTGTMSKLIREMVKSLRGISTDAATGEVTGGVLSMGKDDTVETLSLIHTNDVADGVRRRLLANLAATDGMPTTLLSDDPFATGHADGTEDRKKEAEYLEGIQSDAKELVDWLDGFVMRMAWDDEFLQQVKNDYPQYSNMSLNTIFYQFKNSFDWKFQPLIIEPEEIKVKNQTGKIANVAAVVGMLSGQVDDDSKSEILSWSAKMINDILDDAHTLPDALSYQSPGNDDLLSGGISDL